MKRGNNFPVLLWCTDGSGTEEAVVVKFRAGFRNNARGPLRELLGALVARRLGLTAPEPVLVEIGDDFHEAVLETPEHKRLAAASAGLNFGSVALEPGFRVWLTTTRRPSAIAQDSLENILAFDVLVQNPDRESHNPNLLFRGSDIAVIDHERCFAYLRDESSWAQFMGLYLLRQHVLWRYVDRKSDIFGADLYVALDALTEDWFAEVSAAVPSVFIPNADDLTRILGYLTSVARERRDFFATLRTVLSR